MIFRERTYGVLLVSTGEKFNRAAAALLPGCDYWPVDTVRSVGEARRALLERDYDIVMINAPLPDETGVQLAVDVCAGHAGALLFLKAEHFEETDAKTAEYGVLTLSKPASSAAVAQSLRHLRAMRERMRRLEEKQASVEEKIEEIRLVNHAKWLMIREQGVTEAEAHRLLEKQAMDTRTSKQEVAEAVIQRYEGENQPGKGAKRGEKKKVKKR